MRPIKVGRNFGESVEVLEGVTTGDQLVLNPPDSLNEGDKVAVAPTAAPGAKGKGKEK
jgi:multidrug efflux pump subunit AcrA (membrane-fusion protein)